MNIRHLCFIFFIMCGMAGCGRKNQKPGVYSKLSSFDKKRLGLDATGKFKEEIRQIESKLYDIPIPFQAQPLEVSMNRNDESNVMLLYSLEQTASEEVSSFYNNEMERFGWQKTAEFSGEKELLLIFIKPRRYCSVSMRYNNNKRYSGTQLIIISGARIS